LYILFKFAGVSVEDSIEGKERIDGGVIGSLDFVINKLLELGW
jgi:hypothetical protein